MSGPILRGRGGRGVGRKQMDELPRGPRACRGGSPLLSGSGDPVWVGVAHASGSQSWGRAVAASALGRARLTNLVLRTLQAQGEPACVFIFTEVLAVRIRTFLKHKLNDFYMFPLK